ncbi:MAG: hypothetical protein M3347_05285 [Armatimonadota bacterium]|nr:hypothetical protein [Armatimonadota bacterium]
MAKTKGSVAREQCIALREAGYSTYLIAETVGVSLSTVRYHVRGVKSKTDVICKRPYVRKNQIIGTSLPPSEDLAYLIGVISGDGNLWANSRTCKLGISCDARYPDLIEKYMRLIERLTGRAPSVRARKGGSYFEICLYGKGLSTLLNIPCGAKASNGYAVPEWIFEKPEYVRKFLLGLIETDGGVYHEFRHGGWCSRCRFTAKYEPIMQAFLRASSLLGYNFRRCGDDARLTITAEVKRLVTELDLTKIRTYKYL